MHLNKSVVIKISNEDETNLDGPSANHLALLLSTLLIVDNHLEKIRKTSVH